MRRDSAWRGLCLIVCGSNTAFFTVLLRTGCCGATGYSTYLIGLATRTGLGSSRSGVFACSATATIFELGFRATVLSLTASAFVGRFPVESRALARAVLTRELFAPWLLFLN